jgi:hypothetical protein
MMKVAQSFKSTALTCWFNRLLTKSDQKGVKDRSNGYSKTA